MNPWESEKVADKLDEYLALPGEHDEALSMIPSLFGISDKATYLAYRSLGLTPAQSISTMGLSELHLELWKETDPYFLEFEAKNINRLQREVSAEIIRLGFIKNMALFVAKDATILRKSLGDINQLSKREFDYLMKIRTHYTPGDLYNLEKALNPGKYKENVVINLTWGQDQLIEGVQAEYQLTEGDQNADSN